jgi:hypothetical protein
VLEGVANVKQGEQEAVRPAIALDHQEFVFGTVAEGTKVAHSFTISNKGSAPLDILRVVPSCGCTASSVTPNKIEPGATGTLNVEFNTEGFSGEKVKTVRVFSNDPDKPIEVVSLKGEVRSQVTLTPAQVLFEKIVKGDATQTMDVEVAADPKSQVKVGSAKSFSPLVVVSEVASDGVQDSGQAKKVFKVSISKDAPVGDIRERVVVEILGAQNKSVNIPVFAKVVGSVMTTPQRVSFGIISGTENISRSVRVDISGGKPVSIKKVTSSVPAVKFKIEEVVAGKAYLLHLWVNPKDVSANLRGQLVLETSSEEQPQVSVGVFGILPE